MFCFAFDQEKKHEKIAIVSPDLSVYYVTTDNYRCEVPTQRKCLKRGQRGRYDGAQDACCDGLTCQEFRIYQLTCHPHPHNRTPLKNEKP